MQLKATTAAGLEDVLLQELHILGATAAKRQKGLISFDGDFGLLYSACLRLRTATRVLVPVASSRVTDQDDLYRLGRSVNWMDWFSLDNTFSIDHSVHSRIFSNSQFAALKLKDAICDAFRDRTGKRPSVSLKDPDVRIHLHINEQECTISMDGAGSSLSRRGYRLQAAEAPLSEALAAGLVLLADPDFNLPFYDFMCGSGTIPLEAYMIKHDLACGAFRPRYAFENWKNFDSKRFNGILSEERAKWDQVSSREDHGSEATHRPSVKEDRNLQSESEPAAYDWIRGTDSSAEAIKAAKNNRRNLTLTSSDVAFETLTAEQISDLPEAGTAIINPPYGERLSLEDAAAFYKELGDIMKRSFKGWQVWVLSGNLEAFKGIGLKPSKKISLFNGPLACSFRRFDMY